VEKGSFVSYGTVLSQLIDNASLKINVYLSEQEAFRLQPGQAVTIHSVVLDQSKTGAITMISDKADASGKFLAEISFANTGAAALKAGMLADVTFDSKSTQKGLAIPVSALTGSAQQATVFVVKGNQVEQRSIKTGIVTADKVQVTAGLQAGEQVVTSGQLNLENGTAITINK
jgi:RND family efflux transporter MFP subunit